MRPSRHAAEAAIARACSRADNRPGKCRIEQACSRADNRPGKCGIEQACSAESNRMRENSADRNIYTKGKK